MRTKKRVLQMNDEELAALLAVVMPGRTIDGLRKDERQEMCIKWLFANNLSMNHEFTFDRQEDEVFVLMNNRKPCSCCRKDCDRVTMSAFDRTPLGASLLQQLEPTSSKLQNGVIPGNSVNQEEDKSPPARPPRIHRESRKSQPSTPKSDPEEFDAKNPFYVPRKSSSDNILDPARLHPINSRRGVPLQPIRIQPLPDERKPPVQRRKYQCDGDVERDQGLGTQFVRECGLCCVDLWSNINCMK